MIQITIDREACIGASACVAAAGKTFALDTEGKSTVVSAQGDPEEDIRAAAATCPTGAIQLEESPPSETKK